VSFQIFRRVGQALLDDGKSSIETLIADFIANLWLPFAGGLPGEKLHENEE
jgi:hypothetical protein